MLDANHEAAFLAFTEIVTPSGVKLHMTAREGMTVDSLVQFVQNYEEAIHTLTDQGYWFIERVRVASDKEAKKKLAEIMKDQDWPIDDKMFLDAMLYHAYENLGLTPDTMKADFDLWVRFIKRWDASDLIAELEALELDNLAHKKLHGEEDEFADIPTLDEVDPIEMGAAVVPDVTIEGSEVKNGEYDASYVDGVEPDDEVPEGSSVKDDYLRNIEIDAPLPVTDPVTGEHD